VGVSLCKETGRQCQDRHRVQLLKGIVWPSMSRGRRTQDVLEAARSGTAAEVEESIHLGADLSGADSQGMTPLHFAASRGNLTTVEVLLKYGTPLDLQDSAGMSPLHSAVIHDREKVAMRLISRGCAVDVADLRGFTPLHLAASTGQLALVRLLVEVGGCSLVAKTRLQLTPMMCAVEKKQYDTMRYLADAQQPIFILPAEPTDFDSACPPSATLARFLKTVPPRPSQAIQMDAAVRVALGPRRQLEVSEVCAFNSFELCSFCLILCCNEKRGKVTSVANSRRTTGLSLKRFVVSVHLQSSSSWQRQRQQKQPQQPQTSLSAQRCGFLEESRRWSCHPPCAECLREHSTSAGMAGGKQTGSAKVQQGYLKHQLAGLLRVAIKSLGARRGRLLFDFCSMLHAGRSGRLCRVLVREVTYMCIYMYAYIHMNTCNEQTRPRGRLETTSRPPRGHLEDASRPPPGRIEATSRSSRDGLEVASSSVREVTYIFIYMYIYIHMNIYNEQTRPRGRKRDDRGGPRVASSSGGPIYMYMYVHIYPYKYKQRTNATSRQPRDDLEATSRWSRSRLEATLRPEKGRPRGGLDVASMWPRGGLKFGNGGHIYMYIYVHIYTHKSSRGRLEATLRSRLFVVYIYRYICTYTYIYM